MTSLKCKKQSHASASLILLSKEFIPSSLLQDTFASLFLMESCSVKEKRRSISTQRISWGRNSSQILLGFRVTSCSGKEANECISSEGSDKRFFFFCIPSNKSTLGFSFLSHFFFCVWVTSLGSNFFFAFASSTKMSLLRRVSSLATFSPTV